MLGHPDGGRGRTLAAQRAALVVPLIAVVLGATVTAAGLVRDLASAVDPRLAAAPDEPEVERAAA